MTIDTWRRKAAPLAVLALAAVTLAGCHDKASPDNVDRRSVERWNYLIAHQAEKAYDYLTPGFRSTQTREAYAKAYNNRPVAWKKAAFKSKTCDEDRCKVSIDVTYSIRQLPNMPAKSQEATSTQTETWLRIDGDWYFLPK